MWKKFETETEGGGVRHSREGEVVCVRKRVILNRCFHTGEHFTRLPSVLFNPDVFLARLLNLSLLLLCLWRWMVLSAVWEWRGVSELMGHSCPPSPVHIFPMGMHLHTCRENMHTHTFQWIHGSLVSWTQCHIPSLLKNTRSPKLTCTIATKWVEFTQSPQG